MSFTVVNLEIQSLPYTVRYENPEGWTEVGMGRSNPKVQTILINNTMPQEQQQATLLHEVIHVLDDMCNLELNEHQTASLATLLYDFMRRNPDVVRGWL